ncbi:MAG: triose-phosphate isomerase [Aestuariivirgaceae bacterium]
MPTNGGARALVAGNWKMHGTTASLGELRLLATMLKGVRLNCDVLVCPPATLLMAAHRLMRQSPIALGGQDCHAEPKGPHTGDIAAEMLKDAGASAVILGHSERRTEHAETDALVRAKTLTAQQTGLSTIVCIGESQIERQQGKTLDVITKQIFESLPPNASPQQTIMAYEPIWAIGTGLTPTLSEIEEVHRHIRALLAKLFVEHAAAIPILYGGSVKPANAVEITAIPDVDGALVGGASLRAADFIGIIKAYS